MRALLRSLLLLLRFQRNLVLDFALLLVRRLVLHRRFQILLRVLDLNLLNEDLLLRICVYYETFSLGILD